VRSDQSRTIFAISVIFFTCLDRLFLSSFHNSRDSEGFSDKSVISSLPSKLNNSENFTFKAFDIFSIDSKDGALSPLSILLIESTLRFVNFCKFCLRHPCRVPQLKQLHTKFFLDGCHGSAFNIRIHQAKTCMEATHSQY